MRPPALIVITVIAVFVGLGCEKRSPPSAGAAPAASSKISAASSGAVPPPDLAAVKAACEEQMRVHDAAEDQYFGTRSPHDILREALTCVAQASLPGSGLMPDRIRDCARAEGDLARRSLPTWGNTSKYCDVRGHLERGSACTVDSQCATGHCVVPRGAECGVCGAPLPDLNEPCSVDACGVGLHCNDHRCIRGQPVGAACNNATPCDAEGTCVASKCIPLGRKGERCDENASLTLSGEAPACLPWLDCGQQHKCIEHARRAQRKRKLTENCGEEDQCVQGYCKRRESETGMCVPYNVDGTSCDPDEDACTPPAYCSRTDKRCEILGAHKCG